VDEHQVWLHKVKLLQIPIPPGATPSKRQLKDWAASRVKVDVRWVESRSGEDEGELVTHRFDFDEDPLRPRTAFPGGNSLISFTWADPPA